jgi:hypothetical protein
MHIIDALMNSRGYGVNMLLEVSGYSRDGLFQRLLIHRRPLQRIDSLAVIVQRPIHPGDLAAY